MTTAQREAWKLDGKERSHIGFEVEGNRDELTREPADPRDVVAIRSELRFALDVFATVPERRREAKALLVTGFKDTEIQAQLGLTYTRVNHLISEANRRFRPSGIEPHVWMRSDRRRRAGSASWNRSRLHG